MSFQAPAMEALQAIQEGIVLGRGGQLHCVKVEGVGFSGALSYPLLGSAL